MIANFLDPRLPDRIWNQIQPCPMSGCWLWIGYAIERGYGRTKLNQKSILAHRLTFTALVGPIEDRLVLDHLCRTTSCVNPAHLEPVTQRVNVLRGDSAMARRAAQTHCKNGHELAGDNLRVFERSPGCFMRTCVICNRAANANRKHEPLKLLKVIG